MGKRGFVRREASPKELLEHCLRLPREVAPPTPKGKRGRPWRYDHALYLALLLYRAFFRLTYRKTEASLQDLMEGPFPSHQSLARYAVRHLDPGLLEALLERLSRELEAHLAPGSSPKKEGASSEAPAHLAALSPLYLMYTTGLTYRSKGQLLPGLTRYQKSPIEWAPGD